MRILLIDNYDSFTYNLLHLLYTAGASEVVVQKNNKVTKRQISRSDALVFSPGPGLPSEAGLMKEIIEEYCSSKKMLGVCLGHQAIGEVFGAQIVHSGEIIHGEATQLHILDSSSLFKSIPEGSLVGRYHSWIIAKENFPSNLSITATDSKGVIMAIKHKEYNISGIQFHPESVMTPLGLIMMQNWLAEG